MGKKILVVDDEAFQRTVIKDAAEVAGHQIVGEAEGGQDAVAKFLSLRPDVVTMSLCMAKSSGLEGLQGILKHDSQARVIVVCSLDQKQELKSAIIAGAFDFIVKPFDEARVTAVLQKASS